MLIISHQENTNKSHSEMPARHGQDDCDDKDIMGRVDRDAENLEPSHPAAGNGITQLLWETIQHFLKKAHGYHVTSRSHS